VIVHTFPSTPVQPLALVAEQDETFPALPEELKFPVGFSDRAWRTGAIYEQYSRLMSPEGYEEYHESCFIAMLSILSLRRIRIPFSRRDYTPMMIILMAEPGTYKKTTTADVAARVLYAANLGWMLQSVKTTPQALIHEMSGIVPKNYGELDELKQHSEKKRIAFAGQKGLVAGEFGQFVKSMMRESGPNTEFQSLLLEMDDCRDSYDTGTILRGREIVQKPFLSLVGCMTPTNVRILAAKDAELYGSGFWSRIAVSCPSDGKGLDCPFDIVDVPVPSELINTLLAWHRQLGIPACEIEPVYEANRKGEMIPVEGKFKAVGDELPEVTVSFGAGVYEAWKQYRSAIKAIATTQLEYKDLRGNYDRLATKAMRIAALLGSLENDNRVELWHWAKAQEICERWRVSLHELYRQSNASSTPATKLDELLLETIKLFHAEDKKPTIREMQQRIWKLKNQPAKKLMDVLKQLQRDDTVVIENIGKAVRYSLPVPKMVAVEIPDSFEE
jgi:hypothetical protein